MKAWKEIKHKNYTVELETPTLYVDNNAKGRSGHMSHAMAEFAPNCLIDFNSNCSKNRWGGHSPYGWVEYCISRDSGKTFSAPQPLPYSWDCFLDGIHMISVEKAVACNDGSIVAFCLRNDATASGCCEPWGTPTVIRSTDEGKTWSYPIEYSPFPGRSYDALIHNGIIYVLHFCNEHFLGTSPEHKYRIYTSTDCGKSFSELCTVPFDTRGRGYGSILFDENNILHAYAYNSEAEQELDHAVSLDLGKTWTLLKPCHLAQGIRNPQTAFIDGVYILHGRAGDLKGFVLYSSENAADWDNGCLAVPKEGVSAYYSNNVNLHDENGNFLLIQYSDTYNDTAKVNVMHMKLRIRK